MLLITPHSALRSWHSLGVKVWSHVSEGEVEEEGERVEEERERGRQGEKERERGGCGRQTDKDIDRQKCIHKNKLTDRQTVEEVANGSETI